MHSTINLPLYPSTACMHAIQIHLLYCQHADSTHSCSTRPQPLCRHCIRQGAGNASSALHRSRRQGGWQHLGAPSQGATAVDLAVAGQHTTGSGVGDGSIHGSARADGALGAGLGSLHLEQGADRVAVSQVATNTSHNYHSDLLYVSFDQLVDNPMVAQVECAFQQGYDAGGGGCLGSGCHDRLQTLRTDHYAAVTRQVSNND